MSNKSASGSFSGTDIRYEGKSRHCCKTKSSATLNENGNTGENVELNCNGDGVAKNKNESMDMLCEETEETLSASDSGYPLCSTDSNTRVKSNSLETLGYYDEDWNGNLEVLFDWINKLDFIKNQKAVHRDFSDGILMAELLKKLWPKMVDLHNYSTANSFSNKLTNWTTLNTKVFRKLKLTQSQKTLEDLAKAEPGVIENLLGKVKNKYEHSKVKFIPPESVHSEDSSTSIIVLNGQKIHKNQLSSLMAECRQLQDDLTESDEVIKILKNKVYHLEDLVAMRDETIANLQQELRQLKGGPTNAPSPVTYEALNRSPGQMKTGSMCVASSIPAESPLCSPTMSLNSC